jgi:uncharacterized lipoprotein YajG
MFRMVIIVAVTVSIFAADSRESKPIGSVSSRGAIRVSGTTLDIAEVPSWPVVAGDVIQTQAEPATILLDDGTRLTADPSSTITLTVDQTGKLLVKLTAGAIRYSVSKNTTMSVIAGKQTIVLQPGTSGTVSLDGNRTASGDDKTNSSKQRRPVLSPHEP